jgi:galactokinase
VNLLGEHIDYSGYGVLPMAITSSVIIRVQEVPPLYSDAAPTITISNTDPNFKTVTHSADPSQSLDLSDFHWSYYFLCGYKGAFDKLASTPQRSLKSLQITVDGNVPSGAGLSSSSAFVVASTLATAAFYDIPLTRTELAQAAIDGELYCGTMSGGMDQAASILSVKNSALYIQFVPSLTSYPVTLPTGVSFVIANCLRRKEKAVDAGQYYNLRVVECRLAALCIAKKRNLLVGGGSNHVKTLGELAKAVAQSESSDELSVMRRLASECTEIAIVESAASIATILGCKAEDLVSLYFSDRVPQATEVFASCTEFKIWNRARHVFEEALRVIEVTEKAAIDGAEFGAEMDKSHESCKSLFECSCEELDELVRVCKIGGAMGSRLTGAGWGGCVVSCVREGEEERFLDHLKSEFYGKYLKLSAEEIGEGNLCASSGGDGASIVDCTGFA